MSWYHYIACFFSGAFLINALPHLIHGISGDRFPTPFAKPPGRGLSSPRINVLWSAVNLVVGYLLFNVGHISNENPAAVAVFASGVFSMGLFMAGAAAQKHTE